ncbi:MAG TPA: HAMP domain-containing sensor histidine kinase [Methylomirabilota bacterium]|nr:HAMP domain-containing sensor histidine kinase [Methylomirabilota bacterium]
MAERRADAPLPPPRAAAGLTRLGRTTAFRLATIQIVVFAVLTAVLIGYVAVRTDALLTRQTDTTIDAEISSLADAYQRGGIRLLVFTVEARARRPGASLYLLADNSGRTLVGNVADLPLAVLALPDGERTLIPYRRLDEEAGRTYQALVRVFTLPGGFRLLVGRDVGDRQEFQAVIRDAALAAVAVMLLTGLVSWFLVGRTALKRVEQMAETARGIMTGDLHRRLAVTGSGDEFDNLADSLNAMLARIEALMTGLKEVSDNIAHDLKTPLTRLRTRLEAALRAGDDPAAMRGAMAESLADADTLIAVFDALLRIARLEAGMPGEASETVDAAAVAAEVGELYEPVVEDAGGRFETTLPGPLPVVGNRALLAQALTNLIDNALKYGAPESGAPTMVRLEGGRVGDTVRISVVDRGRGICEADRARATERFVRLDESRTLPGSGLGLALVSAVARLHGGRLELGDASPGLAATLVLPAGMAEKEAGVRDHGETADDGRDQTRGG